MPGSVGQYTQGWFSWVANYSNVNPIVRENQSSMLGMARLYTADTLNSEIAWQTYMDSVTWKLSYIYQTSSGYGIATFLIDGVSVGTIDQYAAAGTVNNYSEITGIAVATPAVKTLAVRAASRNASSTGYFLSMNSIALIRIGGTPSTPAGTDTPGYTWEWIPWMGSKANTAFNTRQQAASYLSGGILRSDNKAQNNAVSTDAWLDTGTHTVHCILYTWTDMGIHNIQLDGVAFTTFDAYSAAGAANTYMSVSGLTIATSGTKTVQDIMATKNASSTNYDGILFSLKFTRTGA